MHAHIPWLQRCVPRAGAHSVGPYAVFHAHAHTPLCISLSPATAFTRQCTHLRNPPRIATAPLRLWARMRTPTPWLRARRRARGRAGDGGVFARPCGWAVPRALGAGARAASLPFLHVLWRNVFSVLCPFFSWARCLLIAELQVCFQCSGHTRLTARVICRFPFAQNARPVSRLRAPAGGVDSPEMSSLDVKLILFPFATCTFGVCVTGVLVSLGWGPRSAVPGHLAVVCSVSYAGGRMLSKAPVRVCAPISGV